MGASYKGKARKGLENNLFGRMAADQTKIFSSTSKRQRENQSKIRNVSKQKNKKTKTKTKTKKINNHGLKKNKEATALEGG